MKKRYLPLLIATLAFCQPAHAAIDILPAQTIQAEEFSLDSESTHPPLRITPDKSELIRLNQEAATILIGNPNHLSILAENGKTLVIIPHEPGASHFTVLDKQGEVIMQRHVITAAPKQNYVRVRRSCSGSNSKDCQETSVFYCPDMCHSIQTNNNKSAAPESSAPDEQQPGAEEYAQAALKKATNEQEPTAD